jgi:hypothetical protein
VVTKHNIERRETVRAMRYPNGYYKPHWMGSKEGNINYDEPIGDTISLDACSFPPGTTVQVKKPVCPECGEIPVETEDASWQCSCDFDWHRWAAIQFS